MEDPLGLILFVVFFVGTLSICVHRISLSRAAAGHHQNPAPVTHGIDVETINAFPIVKYSEVKDIQIGKGITECAVCLNDFVDEDLARLLPECDHVFHPPCIDQWLASHATCPICRTCLLQRPTESNNSVVAAASVPVDRGLRNEVVIHIDDDYDRSSSANLISSNVSHHISNESGEPSARLNPFEVSSRMGHRDAKGETVCQLRVKVEK